MTLKFAYADPPYVGQAKKHYGKHVDYSGEVNHVELVAQLCDEYDGWALSLSIKSLSQILPLCPQGVTVLAWFKPIAPPLGDHRRYNWEPVILCPIRRPGPGYVPMALVASPPQFTFRERPESHVIGEKPEKFAHWVFAAAGLTKADEMHDLFPGSGAIGRAWSTYEPGQTIPDGYASERVRGDQPMTGAGGIVVPYNATHEAGTVDCPVCGCWRAGHPQRVATPDEVPFLPSPGCR